MNKLYKINAPSVVSEVIDGELVIMDLKSGNYFSAERTAAQVWHWIEAGFGHKDLADLMSSHFNVDGADSQKDLGDLIDKLLEYQLVADKGEVARSDALPDAPETPTPYVTPALNIFTDMQDLILLDPIHEVDEMGWPMPEQK